MFARGRSATHAKAIRGQNGGHYRGRIRHRARHRAALCSGRRQDFANDINAERVAAMAAELGASAIAMVGDVTREDDVASLFATAIDRFGSVDASFHVAGANKHA